MDNTYGEFIRSQGFEPTYRGPWATFGHSSRSHGWKLHLSSIPTHAEPLIALVLPILGDGSCSFKVTRGTSALRQLNEGALGATQIGKFITIYPETDDESRRLADILIRLTKGYPGPLIVTDQRLGDIVYTRYGGFNPNSRRDRLGRTYTVIDFPDGAEWEDEYSVPFSAPQDIFNPFTDLVSELDRLRPAVSQQGKLFGPGYLLLETIKSHPKGSVFLAIDLKSQSAVSKKVIKEGRQHCLSDLYGRDIRDRLRHQEHLYHSLKGKLLLPEVDPYFEVEGNGYLPMELIDGSPISNVAPQPYMHLPITKRRELCYRLADLVDSVNRLHECGLIHRDLSPANVHVSETGQVYLLDLELAYDINDDEPAFAQGTPGFMSPQQQAEESPDIPDDVYSLGCLIAFLLSRIEPRRLLYASYDDPTDQLIELTGAPTELANVVAQCLHHDTMKRPTLNHLRHVLLDTIAQEGDTDIEWSDEAKASLIPRRVSASVNDMIHEAQGLLEDTAKGLVSDVIVDDSTGLWLSANARHDDNVADDFSSHEYSIFRSANRGVSGVIYCLARLAQVGIRSQESVARIEDAIDWLLTHESTSDDQLPGLHFGEAGVAVSIAEAVRNGIIDNGHWFKAYLSEALAGPLDWPDITHGAAGQGIAVLACSDFLTETEIHDLCKRCTEYLIKTQDTDGGWTLPPGVAGMSGTRYTGFAHGVAGIIYWLALFSTHFDCAEADRAWRAGADWLVQRAQPISSGRAFEWPIKDGTNESWRWWCHGSSGIALAFLKIYQCTKEDQFAVLADKALHSIGPHFRHVNLSQCHGMSGLGETYLEAAQILNNDYWATRAASIGELIIQLAQKNNGVSWLVENPQVATGDLMVGCGGIAHFLMRLASFNSQSLESDFSFPLTINEVNNLSDPSPRSL